MLDGGEVGVKGWGAGDAGGGGGNGRLGGGGGGGVGTSSATVITSCIALYGDQG